MGVDVTHMADAQIIAIGRFLGQGHAEADAQRHPGFGLEPVPQAAGAAIGNGCGGDRMAACLRLGHVQPDP
ncbi:hypothetical protein D3C72_2198090 [compost metagenome]